MIPRSTRTRDGFLATLRWLLPLAVLAVPAAAHASITVSTGGYADPYVVPTFTVAAGVQSTLVVAKVEAQIDSATVALTLVSPNYWMGTLDLSGLAVGEKTLIVTATDVQGNTGQTTLMFQYRHRPTITVTSPLRGTVARTLIHVAATCADQAGAPCPTFSVGWTSPGQEGSFSKLLYTSLDGTINGDFDLAGLTPNAGEIAFHAEDSAGIAAAYAEVPELEYETNDNLVEVATADGDIVDATCDRLLVRNPLNEVHVVDRATGNSTAVPNGGGEARLTVGGVRWGPPIVSGDYSVGPGSPSGMQLFYDATASTNFGNVNVAAGGLTSAGDVAYTVYDAGQQANLAYFWHAGVTTQMMTLSAGGQIITDGTNFVYGVSNRLELMNAAGTVILNPAFSGSAPNDFQLVGGLAAYTQTWGNAKQVYLYSTADQSTRQLTQFSMNTSIEQLDDAGGALLRNSSGRYFTSPTVQPTLVSSNNGRALAFGGAWHLLLGRYLFRIDVGVDGAAPSGAACAIAEVPTDAGILSGQLDMTPPPPDMAAPADLSAPSDSSDDLSIGSSTSGAGGGASAGGGGAAGGGDQRGCSAAPGQASTSGLGCCALLALFTLRGLRRRRLATARRR